MKSGFTLIELLVVIAIIGLLSTIVIANLNDSRSQAEYKKFGADLVQMRNALQMYASDHNGSFAESADDLTYPQYGHETMANASQRMVDAGYLPENIEVLSGVNSSILYYEFLSTAYLESEFACGSQDNIVRPGGYIMVFTGTGAPDLMDNLALVDQVYTISGIQPNNGCILQN